MIDIFVYPLARFPLPVAQIPEFALTITGKRETG